MIRALAPLLLVVACAPMSVAPASPPASSVQFIPDARGLAVAGSNMRVDFDRAPSGVIKVLDRELGPHEALGLEGCPASVTQRLAWDDLVLTFGPERFLGWAQEGATAGQACA